MKGTKLSVFYTCFEIEALGHTVTDSEIKIITVDLFCLGHMSHVDITNQKKGENIELQSTDFIIRFKRKIHHLSILKRIQKALKH